MRTLRISVAVAVAGVIVLLTPIAALAAMYANLSSNHGRPGDYVLVLSDDNRGTATYAGLSEEDHQPIYLSPTTSDPVTACGGTASQMVGRLQWRGNAAGLAFAIPNLPLADYWLFMATRGQCWRLAKGEPLVLTIGTISADNQDLAKRWTVDSLPAPKQPAAKPSQVPSTAPPASLWLAIAGGVVLVLIVLLILARHAGAICAAAAKR